MANNHESFIKFNKIIRLDPNKASELRKNRDALREKIKKFFCDNKPGETIPKFSGQGSFMMNTIINPLPLTIETEDGETKNVIPFDLDDGVYFLDKLENRKLVNTYHSWIQEAVKTHTIAGTKSKNTCVRVIYADGHHIDLPIYFKDNTNDESLPQLAHKKHDFVVSDPRAFYQWFNKDCSDQLKRIVRYLKSWRDKQNSTNSTKLPNGLVLSILGKENYVGDERDDVAFYETIKAVKDALENNYECLRPTPEKNENLLDKYDKKHFLDRLGKLVESGKTALEEKDEKEGCKRWQKHLGNRFPCHLITDAPKEEDKKYKKPATFSVNAGSA